MANLNKTCVAADSELSGYYYCMQLMTAFKVLFNILNWKQIYVSIFVKKLTVKRAVMIFCLFRNNSFSTLKLSQGFLLNWINEIFKIFIYTIPIETVKRHKKGISQRKIILKNRPQKTEQNKKNSCLNMKDKLWRIIKFLPILLNNNWTYQFWIKKKHFEKNVKYFLC